MDQYELIRTAQRVYQKSIRRIARETGHHRQTIRKALAGLDPKYRRRKPSACPVMGPFAGVVESWLKADPENPAKQRHTARRIYTRLVEEYGFLGAESNVRRWVRQAKVRLGLGGRGAVLPLDPEMAREAEVDWGQGWVRMGGETRGVKLFCMRSRFSGKAFVRAYPWERQEMLFDGHMYAFAYYGGIFPVLVYDNMKVAVLRILRGKARVEQGRFVAFRSHYTFQARFCNSGQAQEKGGVEGLIGFAQRNFLVPLPQVGDFEELNQLLLERCQAHSQRLISGRGDGRTIEERHQEEQSRLLALPNRPFENTKPVRVHISRYLTAQIDRNRYSVPRSYVGSWLWAHVGCDRVSLYAQDRRVAEHVRIFGNSKWQIDPLHYLELLAERVGAFEAARPIRQWRTKWPPDYEVLLSRLRQRRGDNKGTRDFVRILQLHQEHTAAQVEEAVRQAVELETSSYEAVRHLLRVREAPALAHDPLPEDLLPGLTDRLGTPADVARYNDLLWAGGER